jgi:D-alanyl-D-alanine carboxypeptidase
MSLSRSSRWVRCRGDGGQALPLLAVLVALACLVALVVADLGVAAVAGGRARAAADAAALAGAAEGRPGAEAVARANGGSLRSYRAEGVTVEVVVEVDGATARARAEGGGVRAGPVPAGGGDREQLAPAMLAALGRADALLGAPVPVVSGFRSRAEQARLWERRASNPYPVAPPGTSAHETGMAIDVPRSFVPVLLTVAAAAGLCQPLPATDAVHFEPCGARSG